MGPRQGPKRLERGRHRYQRRAAVAGAPMQPFRPPNKALVEYGYVSPN